jgi:hypothetical protein
MLTNIHASAEGSLREEYGNTVKTPDVEDYSSHMC